MSDRNRQALAKWRGFAESFVVTLRGERRTWAEYTTGSGYVDEERVVQPTAFPAFASECLGWTLQLDLAPEESGAEGKPDFTPADSVTHPFVFETKGTSAGTDLVGYDSQVLRYLTDGAPRIKAVVLTNLVGVKVYGLDEAGRLKLRYTVNLRGLLHGRIEDAATSAEAGRLADLLDEFSRKELTSAQKIDKVRSAPSWNPVTEVTSSDWILGRVARVVNFLTMDVSDQLHAGTLTDRTRVSGTEQQAILDELRLLLTRLGTDEADLSLEDFVNADAGSLPGKALQQYAAHVAYHAATRLMLVRVWEDLQLLEPMLYDGGFDKQMRRFDDVISDVITHSFNKAANRYRPLFGQTNSYTWFSPTEATYVDVIYELANTYLGAIESDVLGQVYERLLEQIDRKLLGVYYTPRDVIALIWDLIGLDAVTDHAEDEDRGPRVLDIATGSGGFLVEAAKRLRERVVAQRQAGAAVELQDWANSVADGLNGIELNRFSSYLAELNLLVQFGRVIAESPELRLPLMGILTADTLTLHNPDQLPGDWRTMDVSRGVLSGNPDRLDRARRIKAPAEAGFRMDVACGNPPYIGERMAAQLTADLRRDFPYWRQFLSPHPDYLYWFLILGVSKLREGGRFGFITSEYWLRAEGARPLREYLADRCHIDRIVLFRDFRPFEDAQGHHSMIITGTRVAAPDDQLSRTETITSSAPKVSIYDGGPVTGDDRQRMLKAIRDGRTAAGVRTFTATRSPNQLGGGSWADVILTRSQLRQREHLTAGEQIDLSVKEGNILTANNLTAKTESLMTQAGLTEVGGPGSRAGIQLLTADEVDRLGNLTVEEQQVLRRVVNTKDIYPYAAIIPADAPSVIFLGKPTDIDPSLSAEQVRTGIEFPDGLPNIERHLTRFRPLLEAKTRSFKEKRPWWTIHRPRIDSTTGTHGWANYCIIPRWGAGGRLVVGRPHVGTSPASGLHILQATDQDIPAGYLAGLYNSTLYQEIADSLPPGMLRKADLEAIGVPLRDNVIQDVTDAADALADLVEQLVATHGQRFPLLGESLRGNVALTDLTDNVWSPKPGASAAWGPLHAVSWVESVEATRSARSMLDPAGVALSDDLLGRQITVPDRKTGSPAVTITLAPEVDDVESVAAVVRAVVYAGGKFEDIAQMLVPVAYDKLTSAYNADRDALRQVVGAYHDRRHQIDSILETSV